MSQQHEHISEADYRRYLNDEMSESERNTFEKLLEKYPFEAEALEGVQQLSGGQFGRDMDDLRERVSKRSHRSNRMIWWASAAAVVILIASGILWYNLDHGVSPPPLAEQMQLGKKAKQEPAIKSEKKQPAIPVKNSEPEPPEKKTPAQVIHQEPVIQEDELQPETNEILIIDNDSELVIADDEILTEKEQELPMEASEIPVNPDTMAAGRNNTKMQNNVVVIQNTASPVKELQESAVSEFDFNQPERSQKGKPISAEVSQSKISTQNMSAQPMIDKEKFDAWLREKAVLDEKAVADSVVVVLNLHVDENGKITDFTNANSADQKYYRKARKIINSGPPWQPAMMNGFPMASDVELKVVFRKK